jgi:hypothetical protein
MRYSYIKPREKIVFNKDIQLLFVFFATAVFMLFLTYAFLLFRDYRFAINRAEIIQEKKEIRAGILKMQKHITFVKKQNIQAEKIFTKNSVLRDSVNNLFDLVPTNITLSEANILENGLILYGITPSKDVYNFMLQAPLRSIFHRTYSSFYAVEGGWFRFVSTNYIDEEEFSNED